MIHMKAEITIVSGHLPAMLDLLNNTIFPIMEGKGSWRMLGCFVQRTGRLNTIIDLWEMDSMAEFDRTYEVFRNDPEYPRVRELLDTYVETETLVFMEARGGRILKQKG